jgi:hypothetical protein
MVAAEHVRRCNKVLQQAEALSADWAVVSEHIEGDGPIIFEHACKLVLRRHRLQAARSAVPQRAREKLDQGQEPGEPGNARQCCGSWMTAPATSRVPHSRSGPAARLVTAHEQTVGVRRALSLLGSRTG